MRLRDFLEALGKDELERVGEMVELADVAARLDGNPKAVWFERLALAGNVTGSRSRLAIAFRTGPRELLAEVLRRLRNPGEVVEVQKAPAQEVVERDPDLTTLPVHLQHGFDGAPYVSASVDFTRDAERGVSALARSSRARRPTRSASTTRSSPIRRRQGSMSTANGISRGSPSATNGCSATT